MATTRLDLQNKIYELLGKSTTTYGFLTPTKVSDAINDSLNYISATMLEKNSLWLSKTALANIVANDDEIALPTDCCIINNIRKLQFDTQYTPLLYTEDLNVTIDTTAQTSANYTPTWSLVNGKLKLRPKPGTSLANGIMFEYTAFPAALTADNSTVATFEDYACFTEYAKWRGASVLWSLMQANADTPPWMKFELEWKDIVRNIISKRINKPKIIEGYTDY